MNTKTLHVALIACFSLAGAARADQIYTYEVNLPTIVNGMEVDSVTTQYEFSWVGPLKYNAGPNTACPTVCGPVVPGASVKAGYAFAGFDFTAVGGDAEAQINFSDFSGSDFSSSQTVTFSFIEPDSFWAQQGNGVAFASSDGTTPGASYSFNGGNDPGCTGCTVSISASSSAPEPSSTMLVLPGAVALFGSLRRRKGPRA